MVTKKINVTFMRAKSYLIAMAVILKISTTHQAQKMKMGKEKKMKMTKMTKI